MEWPDGFAFELPPETGLIEQTASFIARERLCYPFFEFRLEVEPEEGPVWLQLTGRKGVKKYIDKTILARLDVPVQE